MGTIIALLSLLCLLAFIVGLIKPSVVRMPNRIRSSVIYLGGWLVLSILGSTLYPSSKSHAPSQESVQAAKEKTEPTPRVFEFADMSLKGYRNETKSARHKIVADYTAFKAMPDAAIDGMYACLSEYSFTKSDDLKLNEVFGWCYAEYERTPESLAKKINFDTFQENFSGWDGSYRPLERFIKDNMNDDSSYKHVSTSYRLILGKDPHAIVKTVFRGKNAYGGTIKDEIAARVDLQTGELVKIIK
ncbi:hypothetical protein [Chimaeribacter arupi]|uniref:Uncharacterized protein n=1 Tax=Chimaeribacter arupi TaxID=2060066 RepID=A0A2N5EJ57_9GAMM|nr:hypothetical protein [Chimaeribacter arupi]PLR45441.1 hypothetical protein CYR34_17720 [Chimaeribacter arupi]